MGWVRIDDQFHSHPKAVRAWSMHRASLGLHMLAMSYASCFLTDGVVDAAWVEEKLPRKRERDGAVDALVAVGLWEPVDLGYRIHDWHDFNPPAEEIRSRRQEVSDARSKAGKRGAETRWANGKPDSKSMANPDGKR